jgi:hypothetical protein
MKKILTITFLLLYAVMNVGVSVIIHTCGGASEALLVTSNANDPCACGDEMSADDMCCTTEIKTIKLDDSQKTAAEVTIEKLAVIDLLFNKTESLNLFPDSGFTFYTLIPFSPPPINDYQVINSVFLI